MAVNSVTGGAAPPPTVQPVSREPSQNGQAVRSDYDSGNSTAARNAPPPDTSPQGKMVGSLVDTKA